MTDKRNPRNFRHERNVLRAERSPYIALAQRGADTDIPEPSAAPDTPRVAWLKRLVASGAFTGGKTHGGLLRHDVIDPDTHHVIRAEVRRATA